MIFPGSLRDPYGSPEADRRFSGTIRTPLKGAKNTPSHTLDPLEGKGYYLGMKSLKCLASVSLITSRLFIVPVFLLAISSLSAFATEAEDEQLLGLWESEESCFVHIYQTDDNQLVGAAWGQRKESAELLLTVGDDRRFPWKRKSKKSGFGDDGELDPKRKGRFIVDSNDRSILHSNFSPCFIRKGARTRWKRVDVSSIAIDKVPKWYQANFESSQTLAASGQPEVEDTESAASIEAKAKVKVKNQAQAKSAEPKSETVATSVQTATSTTTDSEDKSQTGPEEKANTTEAEDENSGGLFKSLFGSKDSDNVKDQESRTGRSADEDSSSDSSSSTQQSNNLLGGLITGLVQLDKTVQKAVEDVAGVSLEDQTPGNSTQGSSIESPAAGASGDPETAPVSETVELIIETNVEDWPKTLYVDGDMEKTDSNSVLTIQVEKGLRQIKIEAEGYSSWDQLEEIEESLTLDVTLEPAPSGEDLCASEHRICPPDESKTLFINLAEKRGLVPDVALGCDSGCDECGSDLDELVKKAGGRDKLKLLLSGRCVDCDLSGLDLRDVDLSTASQWYPSVGDRITSFFDVRGSNLQGADFSGMHCRTWRTYPGGNKVSNLSFSRGCFHHAHDAERCIDFEHGDGQVGYGPSRDGQTASRWIDLTEAIFNDTDLRGNWFTGLKGTQIKFTDSDLRGATFECSVLSDTLFHGSDLTGASFGADSDYIFGSENPGRGYGSANYKEVVFHGFGVLDDLSKLILSRSNFSGVRLEGAYFSESIIVGGNFSNANLKRVIFDVSDLTDADFTNADLRGAEFIYVDLTGAVFDGAIIDKDTMFQNSDLSNVRFDKTEISQNNFIESKFCKTMTPWGQDDAGCGE